MYYNTLLFIVFYSCLLEQSKMQKKVKSKKIGLFWSSQLLAKVYSFRKVISNDEIDVNDA